MLKTYASSKGGSGTVTSVTGQPGRITVSTGTTTPVIDISATFEALLGKVANPLSQFAATTSAQLRGVLSDENGGGVALFDSSTSATFITPILGTPTSVTLTNATGLPLTTGITGVLPIANGGTAAATTSQNFAFIGPTSGSGAPSFRALVAGDIPSLSYVSSTGTTGDINSYSATNTPSRIAAVATGSLFASAGIGTLPAWSASPTLTTSLTTPLIIGGTSTTQTLTYKTTTGVGTTGADHIFQVGNNGATEAMRILNDGSIGVGTASPTAALEVKAPTGAGALYIVGRTADDLSNVIFYNSSKSTQFAKFTTSATNFTLYSSGGSTPVLQVLQSNGNVSIGNNALSTPTAHLHLPTGTATANTAPEKFTAGTVLTTPESGVLETNAANELYYSTSTSANSRGFVGVDRYVAKTGTYTATADDGTIDCTSGTFTVTLPTAVSASGRIYIVKNSGAGTVTIGTTSSQTIDGVTTKVLSIQYTGYAVQSNGANWLIIAAF